VKFGFVVHPLNPAQLRAFAMDSEFVERLWQPHEFMLRFLRRNRDRLQTAEADWVARAKGFPNFRVRTYPQVRSDGSASTSGIVVRRTGEKCIDNAMGNELAFGTPGPVSTPSQAGEPPVLTHR
jgi:hypothetical protein